MNMYNYISLIGCLCFSLLGWTQGEETGPLTGNPHLQQKSFAHLQKVNVGTYDSTFIYLQDTISLPIFDEFSTNKFQDYNATYTDLGVTSDKEYRLLDIASSPLTLDAVFTSYQTYRRTWTISTSSSSQTNFPDSVIQVGNLSTYPGSYASTSAYPPYHIYDTINTPTGIDLTPDTVFVVGPDLFQDSATQFFAPVDDLDLYWIESEVYHNYTFAVDPWTLGVATFDGLDENGFPYDFGSTAANFADHMTSKPIDMGSNSASDSIYLSFLYQTQGYGDEPESTDSLILEFYAHDLQQWNQVWSVGGAPVSDFKVAHIRLDSTKYFKKGFQFRFKSYGGLSGSLDHFHLDYVHLRTLSGIQDTLFKDFAIVYPVNTLLKDYTSVPWDHWKNNFTGKMSNLARQVVRNGSNISENDQNGSTEIFYSAVSEATVVLNGQTLAGGTINYDPRTTYYSYHDFSAGYHYDETKPGISQTFDYISTASAPFPNFTGNDSTTSQQIFENYYSYDDGSAEKVYGTTGVQSRLAIQYEAYEADSIIGVEIHWVPSVLDVSNNLFFLTIWDDIGGEPGNVLYEDNTFFPRQPHYEFDRNLFTTYYLDDTMQFVSGKFYVGWRQQEADRLNVGLDMNIDNKSKTFYSVDGGNSWDNSSFEGSVMIRPVFSTEMDVLLGIRDEPVATIKPEVLVYPNPATNVVNIKADAALYQGVQVFDLMGRLIIDTDSTQIDLSTSPNGVYIFRLKGIGETVKVIKQ